MMSEDSSTRVERRSTMHLVHADKATPKRLGESEFGKIFRSGQRVHQRVELRYCSSHTKNSLPMRCAKVLRIFIEERDHGRNVKATNEKSTGGGFEELSCADTLPVYGLRNPRPRVVYGVSKDCTGHQDLQQGAATTTATTTKTTNFFESISISRKGVQL